MRVFLYIEMGIEMILIIDFFFEIAGPSGTTKLAKPIAKATAKPAAKKVSLFPEIIHSALQLMN